MLRVLGIAGSLRKGRLTDEATRKHLAKFLAAASSWTERFRQG